MTNLDLAELRRLAEAALATEDQLRDDWWQRMIEGLDLDDEADAAYIAAANPATILALLDLLQAWQDARDATYIVKEKL